MAQRDDPYGLGKYKFPLKSNERILLDGLRQGPCEKPHGAGPIAIVNLKTRGWIKRSERLENFGPERYALTDAGKAALEWDDQTQAPSGED